MIILKDNIHFEALYRIYTSNSLLLINISDIVRSTNVQKLDEMHKAGRRDFCQWILDKDKDFPDFVIFSDEKNFTERTRGNRQNEWYWDWTNPNITEEN